MIDRRFSLGHSQHGGGAAPEIAARDDAALLVSRQANAGDGGLTCAPGWAHSNAEVQLSAEPGLESATPEIGRATAAAGDELDPQRLISSPSRPRAAWFDARCGADPKQNSDRPPPSPLADPTLESPFTEGGGVTSPTARPSRRGVTPTVSSVGGYSWASAGRGVLSPNRLPLAPDMSDAGGGGGAWWGGASPRAIPGTHAAASASPAFGRDGPPFGTDASGAGHPRPRPLTCAELQSSLSFARGSHKRHRGFRHLGVSEMSLLADADARARLPLLKSILPLELPESAVTLAMTPEERAEATQALLTRLLHERLQVCGPAALLHPGGGNGGIARAPPYLFGGGCAFFSLPLFARTAFPVASIHAAFCCFGASFVVARLRFLLARLGWPWAPFPFSPATAPPANAGLWWAVLTGGGSLLICIQVAVEPPPTPLFYFVPPPYLRDPAAVEHPLPPPFFIDC